MANNEEIMPLIIEESSTVVAFEVKMFKIFYDNKSEINALIILSGVDWFQFQTDVWAC